MPPKSAGGFVSGVFVSSLNVTAVINTCLCKGLPSDAGMNGTQTCALKESNVWFALSMKDAIGFPGSKSPAYHKQGLQAGGMLSGAAFLAAC
jgi:hypothetical protein